MMGWIKQTAPPCKHPERPKLPDRVTANNEYMVGDVWECDNCQLQFEVRRTTRQDGMQHDPYTISIFEWSAPKHRTLGYLDR